MAKYFKDDEIAAAWLAQRLEGGSTRPTKLGGFNSAPCGFGARQSFEGPAFYSYRTVVARLVEFNSRTVLCVNGTNYSPMTNKQIHALLWKNDKTTAYPVIRFHPLNECRGYSFPVTAELIAAAIQRRIEANVAKIAKLKRPSRLVGPWLGAAIDTQTEAVRVANLIGAELLKDQIAGLSIAIQTAKYRTSPDPLIRALEIAA